MTRVHMPGDMSQLTVLQLNLYLYVNMEINHKSYSTKDNSMATGVIL